MFTFVAITCLFGAAVAAPHGADVGLVQVDNYAVPRYEFNYAVNDPSTGDNKAQSEWRDGDAVKGSYSLTEPDGTLRIVEYTADAARGFNAIVKRIGAAGHPQTLVTPVVTKQIAAPIIAAAPAIAPIATPILKDYSYSTGLGLGFGLGGWNDGLGLLGAGLESWNLGGWKH